MNNDNYFCPRCGSIMARDIYTEDKTSNDTMALFNCANPHCDYKEWKPK